MKTSSKIFSLLMAVMMLLSLAMPAFGAGETSTTYTLTINGQYPGHTYKAYRVFKGTLENDVSGYTLDNENGTYYKLLNGTYTNIQPNPLDATTCKGTVNSEGTFTPYKYAQSTVTKLKNIEWGAGVNGDGLLTALKAVTNGPLVDATNKNLFEKCENAADVAEVITDFADNQEQIDAFATIVNQNLVTPEAPGTLVYTLDMRNGTYYKLTDGTYTETAPEQVNAETCEGDVVEGEFTPNKYTLEPKTIFNGLKAGYYFVKDETPNAGDDTITKYMLQVVKNTTVTAKADKPTLDKFTYREAGNGETGTYYKLANGEFTNVAPTDETRDQYANDDKTYILEKNNEAGVGDVVKFYLESTVPKMDGYDSYTFKVEDTMSKGLTFNNNVVIKVGGVVVPDGKTLSEGDKATMVYYTLTTVETATGMDITIDFVNFINYKGTADVGKPIVITYSATVNENANIGNIPNTNTAKLTYSKNPYKDPDDEEATGTTPEAETNTYVTAIKLTKIDGDTKEKLTGAKFQISGTTQPIFIINEEMFVEYSDEDATNGITPYWRLTDGTYTTTNPNGDNIDTTIYEDINVKYKMVSVTTEGYFVEYTEADETAKVTKYWLLTNGHYTTVDPDTLQDNTKKALYVKENDNYKTYKFVKKEDIPDSSFTAEGWVDANGVLTFSGLGAGTYTITEIKAPDGYNSLSAPLVVFITFDADAADNAPKWTATKDGEPVEVTDNIIAFDVENRTGSTLPSTGGIGTTIFYVLGGMLAVGAVVILVTRKRMEEESTK